MPMNKRESKALEAIAEYGKANGLIGSIAIIGGLTDPDTETLVQECAKAAIDNGFTIRTTGSRGVPAAALTGAIEMDEEDSLSVYLPWLANDTSRPAFDPTGSERRLDANGWAILLGKPMVDKFGQPLPAEEQPSQEEVQANRFTDWKDEEVLDRTGKPQMRDGKPVTLSAAEVERRAHGQYRSLTNALQDKARYIAASDVTEAFFALTMSDEQGAVMVDRDVTPVDYDSSAASVVEFAGGNWEKLRPRSQKLRVVDSLAIGEGDERVDVVLWVPDPESLQGGIPKKAKALAEFRGVPTLKLDRSTVESFGEFIVEAAKLSVEHHREVGTNDLTDSPTQEAESDVIDVDLGDEVALG